MHRCVRFPDNYPNIAAPWICDLRAGGRKMKKRMLCAMLTVFLVICGCSQAVISKQIRDEATPVAGFDEVRQNPDKFKDRTVIVGGEVIAVRNHENGSTTLMVLAFPLDDTEMPERLENSQGRFLVNTQQFLDPAVYARGRDVTVAGMVTGVKVEPVGKTEYRYVVVNARQVYLWPRRYYRYYIFRPYWHHPGMYEYWEPWWGPDY